MQNKATFGIILTLVLFGMLVSASHIQPVMSEPRTWTVDDDGPADFHTIHEAVNAASPGDTVYVYNGTYYENVFVTKAISLVGENRDATIIDGQGIGSPIFIRADSVAVTGFKIRNSRFEYLYSGIRVDACNHINLTGNILVNNFDGICVTFSSNDLISNNLFANNNWNGIHMKYSCNYNVISSNTFLTNKNGIEIEVYSNDNYVLDNYIADCEWDGIDLMGSKSNNISGNTIAECFTGIYTGCETDNMNVVYHNNFIHNTYQVTCYSTPNMWDDGYPSGGNYWSNYAGVDLKKGANQDVPGSDGIGDTPYNIKMNGRDRYPLMNPWTPAPPVVTATLEIDPDTLNPRSRGKWITAYIQLPEGYDPAGIEASTILINETISPVLDSKYGFAGNSSEYLVDHNNDGIWERMIKLDRATMASWIYQSVGMQHEVSLDITGQLTDGTRFEGAGTLFVLWEGHISPSKR